MRRCGLLGGTTWELVRSDSFNGGEWETYVEDIKEFLFYRFGKLFGKLRYLFRFRVIEDFIILLAEVFDCWVKSICC
jgi:hypothetical protein